METAEMKTVCMKKCGNKIGSAGSGDFCTHHSQTIGDDLFAGITDLSRCYKPKEKVGQKGLFCPECDGLIGHSDRDEMVFDCKFCHVCGTSYAGSMCHACHFDPEERDRKRAEADERYRREHNLPKLEKIIVENPDGTIKTYDF